MTAFSIGCDPELFLIDRTGKPLSAYGVVKGTKKEPFKVERGAYQVDGMALEFNTDPVPANGAFDQFNGNITAVLKRLKEDVKAAGYKTAKFNISPVQDFGEEIMAAQPDEAKELGCDPDWCAYTKEPNPRPDGDVTFRTASGHIHVGWGADIPVDHPDHIEICSDFVKCLDATVGMFMTIIDTDPRRRELYGKAGAFRPKPYGVEYRTPSNLWLTHVARRRIIYKLVNVAIKMNMSSSQYYFIRGSVYDNTGYYNHSANPNYLVEVGGDTEKGFELVRNTINNGDAATARKILFNAITSAGYAFYPVWRMVMNEIKRMEGLVRPHDHIVAEATASKEKKVA